MGYATFFVRAKGAELIHNEDDFNFMIIDNSANDHFFQLTG